MTRNDLRIGIDLALAPRDPHARAPGIRMVGRVCWIEWPNFSIEEAPDFLRGWQFRSDENFDLAVRLVDGSLWEITNP